MKKIMSIAMAVILCLTFIAYAGEEEHDAKHDQANTPWFDMKNCEFCKNLLKDDQLLNNMTMEYYEIHNGIVSITTVKPDYKASYKEAMDAMMQLGSDMETGKRNPAEVKMCNFCQNYGMLMSAGAKFDYVMGKTADLTIISSDDPVVVEKIKKYGERTKMEMAKYKMDEKTK